MELTFLYPSNFAIVFQDDHNKGIEAVPALLERLERTGAKVTRIDPSTLTQDQRIHEYSRAIIPAVYKKYEVKRIFGTNRHSACWFGVQVPALIVKRNPDDIVGDTYPHREPPNSVGYDLRFSDKRPCDSYERDTCQGVTMPPAAQPPTNWRSNDERALGAQCLHRKPQLDEPLFR